MTSHQLLLHTDIHHDQLRQSLIFNNVQNWLGTTSSVECMFLGDTKKTDNCMCYPSSWSAAVTVVGESTLACTTVGTGVRNRVHVATTSPKNWATSYFWLKKLTKKPNNCMCFMK